MGLALIKKVITLKIQAFKEEFYFQLLFLAYVLHVDYILIEA
jgi:hypothetical protein